MMPRPTKQLYDWNEKQKKKNEQNNKRMRKRIFHGHLFLQERTRSDKARA
jgi:hypothetical protein